MAPTQQITQTTISQTGILCERTHQPIVKKGKAVNPSEKHQMERGKTLWIRMAQIAIAMETGMAQPFNLDKGSRRHFETNKATKNQTTPMESVPQGVSGPCGSAQKSDNE